MPKDEFSAQEDGLSSSSLAPFAVTLLSNYSIPVRVTAIR